MSEGTIARQPWRGLIAGSVSPVRVATDLTTITGTGTVDDPLVGTGGGSSALVFNVKDYGATGNGTTDDTIAITAALTAASAAGGGTVYLPNGTYIISETPSLFYCLNMPANVTLFGQSKEGAILKLADDQGAFVRPIYIQTADVRLANFTIDGNKAGQLDTEEHRAGIFADGSLRTVIEDMIIHDNTGDAIDIFVASVMVFQRCYCHDNDRNAVTFEPGPTSYIVVRDCYFENNGGNLLIEAPDPCSFVWFMDTYCGYPAVESTFSVSVGPGAVYWFLSGLEILGGFNVSQASNVSVENCYIEAGQYTSGAPFPVFIGYDTSNIRIANCDIAQIATQTPGDSPPAVILIQGSASAGAQPTDVVIEGNYITTVSPESHGVYLENVNETHVRNNRIVSAGYGGVTIVGVVSFGTDSEQAAPTQGNVYVEGNYIYNFGTGVLAGVNQEGLTSGAFVCSNNFIAVPEGTSAAAGYSLGPLGFGGPSQCAMSGNDQQNLTTIISTYPPCPILTGGIRGAAGQYNCAGTPNDQIADTVGALAMQRDGVGGVVGWIKTSGTGNTGWQSINVT